MNNILLTGGGGVLGTEFKKYISCDAPTHKEFDITKFKKKQDYKVVIHSAAYTDLIKAETDKQTCFKVNVHGTYNLVKAFQNSYFIYISTEYVKNPVNFYSYTKLWGEEIVTRYAKNYLIVRTLFKPRPFPYEFAFYDQYTTGDYVDVICPMIVKEILKNRTGYVDLGTERKTILDLAKQTVPDIKSISVSDIKSVKLPKDYR